MQTSSKATTKHLCGLPTIPTKRLLQTKANPPPHEMLPTTQPWEPQIPSRHIQNLPSTPSTGYETKLAVSPPKACFGATLATGYRSTIPRTFTTGNTTKASRRYKQSSTLTRTAHVPVKSWIIVVFYTVL